MFFKTYLKVWKKPCLSLDLKAFQLGVYFSSISFYLAVTIITSTGDKSTHKLKHEYISRKHPDKSHLNVNVFLF